MEIYWKSEGNDCLDAWKYWKSARIMFSYPGNILWTIRSIFELYYKSHMDRTTRI